MGVGKASSIPSEKMPVQIKWVMHKVKLTNKNRREVDDWGETATYSVIVENIPALHYYVSK